MTKPVRVSAPAKINLLFAVGALNADGYHDVASVYHAVDLREEMEIAPSADWAISISGGISDAQKRLVPRGDDNLVLRAATLIAKAAQIENPNPINFKISKNIPVAAGLAGGSADAAAALVAINDLWSAGLKDELLKVAAAALGADVPFSILGGTAIGLGRGEVLQPIEGVKKFNWVLAFSETGLSTPSVYRRLDEIRSSRGEDITATRNLDIPLELISALQSGDAKALASQLRNDLQEAAIDLRPELESIISIGEKAGALVGFISGSGPTIAFLTESAESAKSVTDELVASGQNAIAVTGPARGTTLEQ